MSLGLIRVLTALALPAAFAPAADLQSWHGADIPLFDRDRWAVRVRAEYRTGSQWPAAAQVRGGPELRFRASRKFTLIGLYHAIEGNSGGGDWDEYNRIFGGVEIPLLEGAKYTLTSRTAAERFFGSDAPGLARYRESVRLRIRTRLDPYTSTEVFFGGHGFIGVRPNAGVILPLTRRLGLDVGYHFDWREPRYGGVRHILYTYLRVRKAS